MSKNTISIYPDNKLKDQIEKHCVKENRSFNNFILTILKKFFKKEKGGIENNGRK